MANAVNPPILRAYFSKSLVPLLDTLRQMPATLGRLAGDEMTACTVPGCTKSFKAKSINRHYVASLR